MTIGYPDWERRVQQAGHLYVNVDQVITSQVNFGPYYAADWQAVAAKIAGAGDVDYYKFQLTWCTDSTAATHVADHQVTVGPDAGGQFAFPVLAPWLYVQIVPENGTDTNVFSAYCYSLSGATAIPPQNLATQPLLVFNSSVAASTTVYEYATTMSGGPATWALHHSGTGSWEAILQYYSYYDGAWDDMADMYGPDYGRGFVRRVSLPAAPVRVELTNSATTSATMKTSLTAG